jgi:pyruvate dehydrogenase E2 component (dihydrolipoamide acetyltransferase)
MAKEILLPKQGNSVESCIIVEWSKNIGDQVNTGDLICQVETDKAVVDVESPADGILLKTFFEVDDEVPVHTLIALLGDKGEDISSYESAGQPSTSQNSAEEPVETVKKEAPKKENQKDNMPSSTAQTESSGSPDGISRGGSSRAGSSRGGTSGGAVSPRAKNLAARKGVDPAPLVGSGPQGRVIERDVEAALAGKQPLTPAAAASAVQNGLYAPESGSGLGGRIRTSDLLSGAAPLSDPAQLNGAFPGSVSELPVKGIRKVIAQRMQESLASTAQLTLNSSCDATALLALRSRFKNSPEEMGLTKVTINDLVLFAVSRTLKRHEEMNQHFLGDKMIHFENVHLGCAVDTAKGLMVPVIRFADCLSLKGLSAETKRLIGACQDGKAGPDDLSGGTFTITNLGSLGVESFTPVLNPPEVGILGVCTIYKAPVEEGGVIKLQPRMGLSLTFDHRALDGAPAARFLKDLVAALENIDLVLAG